MSELITYVWDAASVELAIECGADHLIIEDSKLSLGSFSDDYGADFSKYHVLGTLAREISPSVNLSATIDIMIHDSHFPLLSDALSALKDSPISAIRIQDAGLISLIREKLPNMAIILATGNNLNRHSVGRFRDAGVDAQSLACDLPYSDIESIYADSGAKLEIQVQGPLLIQYSARRFMHGFFNSGESVIVRDAEDEELPNRFFRFLDTPNGHFMYGHFHRCLLGMGDILSGLPLSGWIVDARGESLGYFSAAIRAYRALMDGADSGDAMAVLKSESGRPQKPGFFLRNNTDEDWRDLKSNLGEGKPLLGRVVSSQKGAYLMVEVRGFFRIGMPVLLMSPEGREHALVLDQMWSVEGRKILDSDRCGLVKLSWVKGMSPGTRVFSSGPL